MYDTRCNKCSTFLVFPSSLDVGQCVSCRDVEVTDCAAPNCDRRVEVKEYSNYCTMHLLASSPQTSTYRCVLCKIKDIPVDVSYNVLDNSRGTPNGFIHNSCYSLAESVVRSYVAETNQRLPTTNIRVRKMRIDP